MSKDGVLYEIEYKNGRRARVGKKVFLRMTKRRATCEKEKIRRIKEITSKTVYEDSAHD